MPVVDSADRVVCVPSTCTAEGVTDPARAAVLVVVVEATTAGATDVVVVEVEVVDA